MAVRAPATCEELLKELSRLRLGNTREPGRRAPYKPLLLLWLFARLQQTGSSRVSFAEAHRPLSELIDQFGPPAKHGDRAALPFYHLEPTLWQLDHAPNGPEGRKTAELLRSQASGQLRPEVEVVLRDPSSLRSAALLLLTHFPEPDRPRVLHAVGLRLERAKRGSAT
jgi:putative restriction endonuclease